MKFFKQYLLHPVLLAAYPPLAMFAANLSQVVFAVIYRPLIASLALCLLFWLLFRLIFKDWQRSALAASLTMILFFSYGHLYQYLRAVMGDWSKHSLLLAAYVVVWLVGLWFLGRQNRPMPALHQTLNIVTSLLVLFSAVQISVYYIRYAILAASNHPATAELSVNDLSQAPDIYYIVLDSYSRADVLQENFGMDNAPFLNELKQMGFYVAECGRSNYEFTEYSMAATLNMDYIQTYGSDFREKGQDFPLLENLIKEGKVRQQLELVGYRTVGLATGFPWGEWDDASIFLKPNTDNLMLQRFSPFEAMFIRSTVLRFVTDLQALKVWLNLDDLNFPYSEFVKRERFALNQMENIASISGPKLVYAHIMTPHDPIIFDAQGEILTDPGFYPADNLSLTPGYFKKGAVGEFEYTNSRILPILRNILAQSRIPPIIIVQGDHGRMNPKHPILNAYYLPGQGSAALYPTITPVNTFRLIFNQYFGAHYPLLPDTSYHIDPDVAGKFSEIPEASPACIHK